MQYFSLVARKGQDRPRTCAMIRDLTMEGARDKARHLLDSDHLAHVDRRDDFSIRRSSRRETSMLQKYLSSTTTDSLSTYLQEDLDSLLSRRNSMILSFFMALYFDQVALKKRMDRASLPATEGSADAGGESGSGGSGGRETDQAAGTGQFQEEAPASESGSEDEEMPVYEEADGTGDQASEDTAIGSDNQYDALAGIVGGGGNDQSPPQDDDEIDIF